MNNDQLTRAIQRVGAGCFVRQLDLFISALSDAEKEHRLHELGGYTPGSCRVRVTYANKLTRDKATLLRALRDIAERPPSRALGRYAQKLARFQLENLI